MSRGRRDGFRGLSTKLVRAAADSAWLPRSTARSAARPIGTAPCLLSTLVVYLVSSQECRRGSDLMGGLLTGLIAALILAIFAFISLRNSKLKTVTVHDNLHG